VGSERKKDMKVEDLGKRKGTMKEWGDEHRLWRSKYDQGTLYTCIKML
jgi:hypothetical protein